MSRDITSRTEALLDDTAELKAHLGRDGRDIGRDFSFAYPVIRCQRQNLRKRHNATKISGQHDDHVRRRRERQDRGIDCSLACSIA